MDSSRQASPTGGSKASPRKTVSWLLGLTFAAVLLSIASATWAPSAALGAGDRYISGTPVAPAALQAIKAPEFTPLRTPEKTNGAKQQSGTDKASSPLRLAANTSTLNLTKQYSKAVNASVAVSGKGSTMPAVASSAGYRSPGALHKISVDDRKLVESLQAQGGRVIADYGSFVLMEANDAAANSVSKGQNAQVVDENNLVLLNAGAIDTTTPAAQSLRTGTSTGGGKQMRLIQFVGPIRPEWYAALEATGAQIVTYIPNNAYLVYGPAQALQAVRQLASNSSIVQWDGDYIAAYRIDPAITASSTSAGGSKLPRQSNLSSLGNEQFAIQMVEDSAENAATLALIEQFKLEPIITKQTMLGYLNVRVTLPRDVVITQIAARGDVVSIQQYDTPRKQDERQSIIMTGNVSGSPLVPTPMNYLAYLAGKGFSTTTVSTFAVNLSDSGVDNATTLPNHFALYRAGTTVPADSRIIYNRLEGTPNGGSTLQGCDGHGNENAHIIGGYVPTGTVGGVNFSAAPHADASGFRWGLGLAPFVKIGSSVIFDPNSFTFPDFENLESKAYHDGARISSNSWGSSSNAYSVDSQAYDALVRDAQPTGSTFPVAGNQEYVIVFAAGNAGSGSNTVGSPSTAKNVITVGAAENVNPFGAADGCGIGDTGANDASDIIGFSSRGPTSDGRKKPDIMAPGTHVSAGVGQASIASPAGSGTGAQLPCFFGGGVCGGTGGSNFFPAGQQWYTASSGTSHSTPAISGVAALIRQHFINQALPVPSPALTKALMMNSARYMTGVGANDTLPSNNQGMGEISLNDYFDIFATAHALRDQVPAEKFTASGQQRVITGSVADISKPLRITLVWTDAPGPTSGNAFVNNLDLEVTAGGTTYKGNVFAGAFSASGGVADVRNNVESVFIPAGVSGSLVIKVKGTNIAGNGVPGDADPLDQDFALVAYNMTEGPLPVITGGGTALTAESCSPPNAAVDPAETVNLNFALSNIGTANTTNLVATLQASGGVTSPSGGQNYGILIAGGPSVTKPYTFTAGTTCGQTLVATFNLQDGATNLGTVSFNLQTGALGAPVSAVYSTGNIAVPIPDVSTVEIPLTIPDTGLVSDVNVKVRLNHTFDGDLVLQLVAPDATIITLAQNRGGSGANYGSGANSCSGIGTVFDDSAATAIGAGTAPFAASFKPETPLAGLAGKSVNGGWKLRVTDTAALDVGTVGCVELTVVRQPFVCCTPPPLALVTAHSQKVHGAAGTFNLPLTLAPPTNPTTEPRQGPAHTVVFTFNLGITGATASITEGSATAGVPTFIGNVVTVPLTNVTNQQYVTVSLTNISDVGGGTGGIASVRIGFLAGDVNQNRVVAVSDVGLVNAQLAQPVNAANYLKDVNATGTLTVADKGITNANLAKALPAP